MPPYYADDVVTLHLGDALEVARTLPDRSADCIVTSPPYFGLRDYGTDGQYGLEASPAEYVETMRALFSELRRVLADDGTLWLNLGDSYGRGARPISQPASTIERRNGTTIPRPESANSLNLPNKSLIGVPWRTALALQADGWVLRNDIIWAKPNGMPERVTDRMAAKHEHLFLFAKREHYWFDLDPIREPLTTDRTPSRKARRPAQGWKENSAKGSWDGGAERGRNPGDVWTIATQPYPGAHFAVFPQELARRCIVAGCKPGGTVLDPFSGSGTTGLVAQENGRKYVGIDISREYLDLSLKTRLRNGVLDLGEPA